jgi:hypothetical protein
MMAKRVRPALSKPDPDTGPPRGRGGDEEGEREFHQGPRPTGLTQEVEYMAAVSTRLAKRIARQLLKKGNAGREKPL